MAPKQPKDPATLLEKVLEKLDAHTESLNEGQDTLASKVDSLNAAYTSLASRLVHVEAKDFGTVVTKIDNTLQKLLLIEKDIQAIGEDFTITNARLEKMKSKMEILQSKIDKFQFYINIVAFIVVTVLCPLAVQWLSKIFGA
jgi:DNA repair ATPase RecN